MNGENNEDPLNVDYPDEVVLDMTNRSGTDAVKSMSELPLGDHLRCLELGLCRISQIEGLGRCPGLRELTLRANQIPAIGDGLRGLRSLVKLDLYSNEISVLEGLDDLTSLVSLDVSFNNIKALPEQALEACSGTLRELYVINNRLKTVGGGVAGLTKLTLLELGSNRLRDVAGVECLPALEQLFVGRNKLTAIPKEVMSLTHLRILALQSNRITKIEGVPETVEELYLSHNGIEEMSGLSHLSKLRVLDLDANRISRINATGLAALEELWLASNSVEEWGDVEGIAKESPGIKTVYLEHNPLASDTRYRAKVKDAIPSVEQIDAEMVGHMP